MVSNLKQRELNPMKILTFSILFSFATLAPAATVSLEWDANVEPELSGYRVHYGTAAGTVTFSMDAGNATTVTIPDLKPGTVYYFTVMAYDAAGLESAPSNEVSTTALYPAPDSLAIVKGALTFREPTPDEIVGYWIEEKNAAGEWLPKFTIEGSPHKLTGWTAGPHTIRVTGNNATGVKSRPSEAFTFTIPKAPERLRVTVALQTTTTGLDWTDTGDTLVAFVTMDSPAKQVRGDIRVEVAP